MNKGTPFLFNRLRDMQIVEAFFESRYKKYFAELGVEVLGD